MKGRTYRYMTEKPLYAFGYGLSYSTFEYGKAKIRKDGDKVYVTVNVKNTSKTDGQEVVQLYVSRPDDTEGPSHALRAFRRVSIPAGKSADIEFELTPESFEWFDTNHNMMATMPGKYEILYGPSSDLTTLKKLNYEIK
jgi:beta-glucosidase